MDALNSGRSYQNRGAERIEAGRYDITSLSFHSDGQSVFGSLTFYGRLVQDPLTSYDDIDAIAPLELPGPGMASSVPLEFDEGSIFGAPSGRTAAFPSSVRSRALDKNGPVEALIMANWQNENPGPLSGARIQANSEFNLVYSSQSEKIPLHTAVEQQIGNQQTDVNQPFFNAFDQADPSDMFSVNESGQKVHASRVSRIFETHPDFPIFSQETALSNRFNVLHDIDTGSNGLSTSPETSFNFLDSAPTFNQESSFSSASSSSSSEFNSSDSVPASSQENLFSSSSSVSSSSSSSELNFSDGAPTSSQGSSLSSSSSNPRVPLSPGTATVKKSPERQSCHLCPSTFKRAGDLKRHQMKHLPPSFHCKQPGCERKGGNGFSRRDKLRDHERQVHGLDG